MRSYLSHLECPKCAATHDADALQNLCPCGSPLLVRYDLDAVRGALKPADLAGRPSTLWRYFELLPVRDPANVISLGEGMTPLWRTALAGRRAGAARLLDERRGGDAHRHLQGARCGRRRVAGEGAGGARGGHAHRGQRRRRLGLLLRPRWHGDAAVYAHGRAAAAQQEAFLVGARCYRVKGLITDAGKIVHAACRKYGWFEAATLKEPYRIEGKKTMGLELAEQLGWQLPSPSSTRPGAGWG